MELLIVLAAVAIGAFFFLRHSTRRGTEAVRAYVYVGSIKAGRTVEEANRAVARDMADVPPAILNATVSELKGVYSGRQLVLIGEAYLLGMQPRMSNAYVADAKAKAQAS